MENLEHGLPLTLPLWEKNVPFEGTAHQGLPRLTVYLSSSEHQTGKMILICPGGGYKLLSVPKEGHRIARFVSSYGHSAAVLEYRHAPYRHPVPLIDAQRALRILRHHAESWAINPSQIGILGFSAGGHLAGCTATLPTVEAGLVGDTIDQSPSHPDFAVLVYPVISLTHYSAHTDSPKQLLGDKPDPELKEALSLENTVGPDTPPTLLIHSNEDQVVPPENSLLFYQALRKHRIPTELHIYETGAHGVGLDQNHPWGTVLLNWLENRV